MPNKVISCPDNEQQNQLLLCDHNTSTLSVIRSRTTIFCVSVLNYREVYDTKEGERSVDQQIGQNYIWYKRRPRSTDNVIDDDKMQEMFSEQQDGSCEAFGIKRRKVLRYGRVCLQSPWSSAGPLSGVAVVWWVWRTSQLRTHVPKRSPLKWFVPLACRQIRTRDLGPKQESDE